MKYDILIIGAGAAGLMAMKDLAEAGYHVCMLEASAVAGGRIATVEEDGFEEPVETGSEFIHGNLTLTLQLLKEAGIAIEPVAGNMITVRKGKWMHEGSSDSQWEEFMNRLCKLEKDITIENFLQQYFAADKYLALRNTVKHYAEGFDLADISRASTLFIKDEWSHQGETQYRIKGGYGKLVAYLEEQCRQQNTVIHFNHPVYRIEHSKKYVIVYTAGNKNFQASKLIVTVPLGVLQNHSLQFIPALTTHAEAIRQLGFGAVIKVLMQFKTNFWKSYADDIGFILSDETIPTWWTQLPHENNLLTGWLGGPHAVTMAAATDEILLHTALQSLSSIFNLSIDTLQQQLMHHKIICWHNNPYIKGGYSYNTITSGYTKTILATPVNDTIFFAGEAYYTGAAQGTVEAALQSGRHAADQLKALL